MNIFYIFPSNQRKWIYFVYLFVCNHIKSKRLIQSRSYCLWDYCYEWPKERCSARWKFKKFLKIILKTRNENRKIWKNDVKYIRYLKMCLKTCKLESWTIVRTSNNETFKNWIFLRFCTTIAPKERGGGGGGVMLMNEQIIPSRFLTCLICMRAWRNEGMKAWRNRLNKKLERIKISRRIYISFIQVHIRVQGVPFNQFNLTYKGSCVGDIIDNVSE